MDEDIKEDQVEEENDRKRGWEEFRNIPPNFLYSALYLVHEI